MHEHSKIIGKLEQGNQAPREKKREGERASKRKNSYRLYKERYGSLETQGMLTKI